MKSAYKSVGVWPTAASQKEPCVTKLVICQHLAASSTWASNCSSLQQDNNRSSATFENVNFRVVVRSRFAAPDGADQQGEDSDYLRGNRGTTPCSYGGWRGTMHSAASGRLWDSSCTFSFTHRPVSFIINLSELCVLYIYRTAVPLPSKCCILHIFSTNISTEYFKHAAHSPFFSSKCRLFHNPIFFFVPVLFTFCIQGVVKFKCEI